MNQNTRYRFAPYILMISVLLFWQGLSTFGIIPKFMLPSPMDVISAFIKDFWLLMMHSKVTLLEAFLGLFCAVLLSFIIAFFMDRYLYIKKALYPVLVLTQTIPTVAIAPLLVLWLGYDMTPKVVLITMTCFFPMTMSLLQGFDAVDRDVLRLMKSMGASKNQIFRYVKFPSSLGHFFGGLRIATSYAVVGAVISEWLGGFEGLGVYMIRVKKSYNFDKMFAVILLISVISLVLMKLVEILQKKIMPWNKV